MRNREIQRAVLLGAGFAVPLALGVRFAGREPAGSWEATSLTLLIGTLAATAATLAYSRRESPPRDAWFLLFLSFMIGWGVEVLGARTGFPFGARYDYHPEFGPQLPGGIPLAIPLSWYVLLRVPMLLLRRWPVRTADEQRLPFVRRVLLKAAACGGFMAALGYLLDPLGQAHALWTFSTPAAGRDALNALGWGIVGFTIAALFYGLTERRRADRPGVPDGSERVVVSAGLFFIGLAFCASLNRLRSVGPPLLSLGAMAPAWIFWWTTCRRMRRPAPATASGTSEP